MNVVDESGNNLSLTNGKLFLTTNLDQQESELLGRLEESEFVFALTRVGKTGRGREITQLQAERLTCATSNPEVLLKKLALSCYGVFVPG